MNLRDLNIKLVNKARRVVYAIALFLVIVTWLLFTKDGNPTMFTANAFGYLSFTLLSLALIVSPIKALWPQFSLNPSLYMARRAFGISAFVFAAFHVIIQNLVIFKGNAFTVVFQMAERGMPWQLVGLIAYVILFLLFITSFDWVVDRMGKWWFHLHKLTYVAYILIFLHAFMIGIDFKNGLINAYSGSFLLIAAITLLLELVRLCVKFTKPKPVV